MHLTDEQWALIRPLVPPPSPHARGRPPAGPRPALDGIFRKISLGVPWYTLPPHASGPYPSWQTCYRRYRRWQSTGLMDQVYRLLYRDLRDRGRVDLLQALQVVDTPPMELDPALNTGTIFLIRHPSGWQLHLPPDLDGTWQGSTIRLLVQVILDRLKPGQPSASLEG